MKLLTPPNPGLGGGRFSQIYFLVFLGRPPYFAEMESKSEDTFWNKNQVHKSQRKNFQVIWKKVSTQNRLITQIFRAEISVALRLKPDFSTESEWVAKNTFYVSYGPDLKCAR